MSEPSLPPAGDVVERALASAKGECIVLVEEQSEIEVRFANNSTTTNGTRRDRRVTVVAFAPVARDGQINGGHQGEGGVGVATGVMSRSGGGDVLELLAAAEAAARDGSAAEDAMELVAAGASGDFFEPPLSTSYEAIAGVVDGLGEACGRARSDSHVLAGFVTHASTTRYLGTSAGTRLRHVGPTGSLQLVARSSDGERSAWAGTGSETLGAGLLDVLEARVTSRLAAAKRKIDLPAGRYDVILPPDAVADLIIVLGEATSGRDAEDGRSVFSRPGGGTTVGEPLSALPFRLSGDPGRSGLGCVPFVSSGASGSDVSVFDNGAPIGPTRWIDEGRLARLRYHRAGAARSGVEFTPPVDNLSLELPGATASLEEVVARTQRGLLLTCLWYIREVDVATLLLTGLTRDGVYLVEDGEIVAAVNNFRFNESPVSLLGRVIEAGRTERALSREWGEWMSRTEMPTLRVAEFNMSSVSPAS